MDKQIKNDMEQVAQPSVKNGVGKQHSASVGNNTESNDKTSKIGERDGQEGRYTVAIKLGINYEGLLPRELKIIPRDECTPENCMEAIKEFAWNLEHVPEEYKTREMCRHALKRSVECGYGHMLLLPHIPFTEVCMEALQRWGAKGGNELLALVRAIRPEVIEDKMADFLVAKNGECLALLPVHLQTLERAEKAVETSGATAIRSHKVKAELKTPEMWLKCAKHSWVSFCDIPWRERSPEVCLAMSLYFPKNFAKCGGNIIPIEVSNNCNVYSICRLMEKASGRTFTFDQMNDFYDGKPIPVKRMDISGNVLYDKKVTFDKRNQKFEIVPLREKLAQGTARKEDRKQAEKQERTDVSKRHIGRKL